MDIKHLFYHTLLAKKVINVGPVRVKEKDLYLPPRWSTTQVTLQEEPMRWGLLQGLQVISQAIQSLVFIDSI